MNVKSRCPTCQARVTLDQENKWRPFCSERCMLIDLGEWMTERRGIPAAEDSDVTEGDIDESSTH